MGSETSTIIRANSLIDIYNETNKNMYSVFLLNDAKIKSDRKRILNSLPLFTISENLLTEILKRNKKGLADFTVRP